MLLELFRNHKRWLMFIAMVLVIPSFVVTGIYSYNRMISDDGAIAKVDDVSILPQQFDEAKRQRLENLRVRLGEEFRSNMLDSQEAKVALLEARRHYCWYLKGVKYANYYKDQINHMETLEDLYRVTAGIKRDLSD